MRARPVWIEAGGRIGDARWWGSLWTKIGLLTAAAVCGCGPGETKPEAQARKEAESLIPHWILERELTIGSANDPARSLTTILDLAVDAEGRIYVSQPMEQHVKVFSAQGDLLLTIGRRGEGPGEFSRPGRLGWRGDTLWVSEDRAAKVSFFEKDGTFVRSHTVSRRLLQGGYVPSRVHHVTSDGSLLVSTNASARSVLDGVITEFPYLRLSPKGEVEAQLAMMAMGNSILMVRLAGGRGMGLPHPLPTRPLLSHGPGADDLLLLDRVADHPPADSGPLGPAPWPKEAGAKSPEPVGETGHPLMRLHKITAAGDTLFTREIPCPGFTIPAYYVEKVARPIAQRVAASRPGTRADAVLPDVVEALDLESSAPLALQMVVASNGDIWIERNVPGAEAQAWIIHSPDGEVKATLTAPLGTTLRAVAGAQVWATERDEWDVPYVVRYRVAG